MSIAPSISLAADDDSNRYLVPQGTTSQSSTLQVSADLTGSTDTTDFSLSPVVSYQAFDRRAFANIFERDVPVAAAWTLERGKLSLTGEDSDKSTLTTEATQTGILSSQLHQRLEQGGVSATYYQTERISLIVTGSYTDVSYYGAPGSALLNLLSGYRYPSGSIAEQWQISETSTLLANLSYSESLSQLPGADERNRGASLDYHTNLSETFDLDATIGASQVLSTSTQHVTTGGLSATRKLEFGNIALSYTRSLTPYGTGALVQRQVFSLSGSRSLTDRLDVTLAASRVQNDQVGIQLGSGQILPVQTYNTAQLLFVWQCAEFWRLRADVDATLTHTPGPASQTVHEWHAGLLLSWSPRPLAAGF